MEVVEDFESRPRKAVTFPVERDKAIQVVNELKIPKASPGFSGGDMPKGSKAEGGTEGNDEEDEVRRVEEMQL